MNGSLAQADASKLQVEGSFAPEQLAIDRIFAAQVLDRCVDHRAGVKRDHSLLTVDRNERQDARLPADVDRLQEIDDAHLRERPAEACPGVRALEREPRPRLPRELNTDARDDFPDVDRFGEVVLDAEL